MKEEEFELAEFKVLLTELGSQIEELVQEDPDYQGEADPLRESINRLQVELKDINDDSEFFKEKFQSVLPDIVVVMNALEALDLAGDESEDGFSEEGLEDLDEEDYEDEEEELSPFQELHDDLLDGFEESPQFDKLSEVEIECSFFILETFCEYLRSIDAGDPKTWTKEVVSDVCLKIFPEKVIAEPELFIHVGPVLGAFFNFLTENEELPKSNKLEAYVKTIQNQIPVIAEDEKVWGPEKKFAMAAMQAEVDLDDPVQLEKFIEVFNANLTKES